MFNDIQTILNIPSGYEYAVIIIMIVLITTGLTIFTEIINTTIKGVR